MGQTTDIAWADSTFNPWIGCQKVSEECDHCYAEALFDVRFHLAEWGPHGKRQLTKTWNEPRGWQPPPSQPYQPYQAPRDEPGPDEPGSLFRPRRPSDQRLMLATSA